jgi:hypothetical protein
MYDNENKALSLKINLRREQINQLGRYNKAFLTHQFLYLALFGTIQPGN